MKTFGAILYGPGPGGAKTWIVSCEPHVRIRMKRVFEQIAKGAHDLLQLSDTPSNAAELLWFLDRYPMTVPDRKYLTSRAHQHRETASTIEQVMAAGYVPSEFTMALPPRDYQRVAADLAMKTGRLLLADDLGLGKTASAICTLTDPTNLPALVVTMSHLPLQWESELKRFLPGLTTHILRKGSPYDIGSREKGQQLPLPRLSTFPDVIISNYHKLAGWAEALAGRVKAVILDECQELRLPGSLKYSAARRISCEAKLRVGLSATPVYNQGGEIHAVMDVLAPGHLGTRVEFEREWCAGDAFSGGRASAVKDPKALGYYLREQGLMLRRTRAEVGRELPPLQRVVHAIDCDEKEIDKVSKSVAELARIILKQGGVDPFQKMRASEEFTNQHRQATGIAKAPYVAAFVKMLAESGEPILLAGWHRTVYEIWLDALKDLAPVMYTGTESPAAKERAKKAFVSGEAKVLIMSLRSGAGLDGLQGCCRTVVVGELDWSPKVHDQLIGRVHRDGQDEPCVAYFPVANSGSDPVVVDVLGLKAAQARGINDPDAPLVVEETSDPDRVKRLAEDFLRQRGAGVKEAA
jgi:hypothetical protein